MKQNLLKEMETGSKNALLKKRIITYNPQNEMFATFQTKRYFIQNETSSKK